MLSSLCYSEYAVEFPVAGGSFTFILHTFGEFWAWITSSNLLMNYILANAAVARAFLPYFSTLCDQGPDFLYVISGGYRLDFIAFGLILLLTVLLTWGMKETKTVNNIITVVHLLVVLFIIVAGLSQAKASNYTNPDGFAPFGARGVWNGAALVFFSYIGFDAVATTAEEVINPGRDIPIGMTLSLVVVTFFYLMCTLSLTLMLPYTLISPTAAFSAAFRTINMDWAVYFVAIGALMGIVTGVLVGMVAVARTVCALGREHYLPPIFAVVSQKHGTPIFSTAILGFLTAMIALFTSFDSLINLVSVCTLCTFTITSCGILWRHYHLPGKTKPWIASAAIVWNLATSIALTAYYNTSSGWIGLVIPGALWLIGAIVLTFVPQAYKPAGFSVPLMPWIPAGSIMLNTFLMGALGKDAFQQWGIFIAIIIGVYFLFSLPNTIIMDKVNADEEARNKSIEDGPPAAKAEPADDTAVKA